MRRYRSKVGIKMEFFRRASFTIEASIVVPITLFALVAMILSGYKVHDIFFSNASANEAALIYSHLPEKGAEDALSITERENSRLRMQLSGGKYTLSMEEEGDGGSTVTITGVDNVRTFEAKSFRPEKTIRALTIVEELADD